MTPYNPQGLAHPHRVRTIAIIAVLLLGVVYGASALIGPANAELPREVYQPTYPIKAPGWLEPTVTPAVTP